MSELDFAEWTILPQGCSYGKLWLEGCGCCSGVSGPSLGVFWYWWEGNHLLIVLKLSKRKKQRTGLKLTAVGKIILEGRELLGT